MNPKFEEYIQGNTPVVVDFFEDFSDSCDKVNLVLKDIKSIVGASATILKMNIENNKFYRDKYKVYDVPTIIIFKRGKLLLWVDNKQHQHLLNELLQNNKQNYSFQVELDLFRNKTFANMFQILIALNRTLTANKKTLKYLFEQDIFLITKINSALENNNLTTYKIYNDLSDFKKIVFITALIEQTLNTK